MTSAAAPRADDGRSVIRRHVVSVGDPRIVHDATGHRVRAILELGHWEDHDPFLALMEDWFTSGTFGPHPHRGIETVSYVIDGSVSHRDNRGGSGILGPGDAQWMTAGRGIIHSEEPVGEGQVHALQLWVNLAAADKLTEPGYQNLHAASVPVRRETGVQVRVFSGSSGAAVAATRNHVPVTMLELRLDAGACLEQELPASYNCFLYVLEGEGRFGNRRTLGRHGQVLWLDRPGGEGESEIAVRRESLGCAAVRGRAGARASGGEGPLRHEHLAADRRGVCRLPCREIWRIAACRGVAPVREHCGGSQDIGGCDGRFRQRREQERERWRQWTVPGSGRGGWNHRGGSHRTGVRPRRRAVRSWGGDRQPSRPGVVGGRGGCSRNEDLGWHDRPGGMCPLVVIAVPWNSVQAAVEGVDWGGQVVVDATNALLFPDLRPADLGGRTSSEIVAGLVGGAPLVKAGNTLPAEVLGADPHDGGGRRVIFMSGDDGGAKASVARLFEAGGSGRSTSVTLRRAGACSRRREAPSRATTS